MIFEVLRFSDLLMSTGCPATFLNDHDLRQRSAVRSRIVSSRKMAMRAGCLHIRIALLLSVLLFLEFTEFFQFSSYFDAVFSPWLGIESSFCNFFTGLQAHAIGFICNALNSFVDFVECFLLAFDKSEGMFLLIRI